VPARHAGDVHGRADDVVDRRAEAAARDCARASLIAPEDSVD
jgi:hypothetical protein